jgi:hypothetical protein
MSISFTAQDSPKAKDTVYTCDCSNWADDKKPMQDCSECKGTGEIRFSNLQYDANFANGNAWGFTELFTPDGKGDYSGCIKHEDMQTAILKLKDSTFEVYHRAKLLVVLEWALQNNKNVYWG